MNRWVAEAGGEIRGEQFTLYGDTRKGNRPSFVDAARPEQAERLYEGCVTPWAPRTIRSPDEVSLVNDGPVTLLIES